MEAENSNHTVASLIKYEPRSCWLSVSCLNYFQMNVSNEQEFIYWSGVVQCILVVVSLLPLEQNGITQLIFLCFLLTCCTSFENICIFLLHRQPCFIPWPSFRKDVRLEGGLGNIFNKQIKPWHLSSYLLYYYKCRIKLNIKKKVFACSVSPLVRSFLDCGVVTFTAIKYPFPPQNRYDLGCN